MRRTIQTGSRDHSFGAVDAVRSSVLSVGSLIEPFAVGRLLGRRTGLCGPQCTQHRQAPRVSQVADSASTQSWPLFVDHGRARNRRVHPRAGLARPQQELRGLELLHHGPRLCFGAAARGVEALEGKEHDESDQHGKARGKHAKDPRRAIAVLEVAARGRTSADEQHRRDRHRSDAEDDEARPDEIHRGIIAGREWRPPSSPSSVSHASRRRPPRRRDRALPAGA